MAQAQAVGQAPEAEAEKQGHAPAEGEVVQMVCLRLKPWGVAAAAAMPDSLYEAAGVEPQKERGCG